MKRKYLVALGGIFLIQLISSCCTQVKHYDFSEMQVEVSNDFIEENEELLIFLEALDVQFIGQMIADLGFAKGLATTCDYGWGGMKFPLESIEITSSSDFNGELLSGRNLIDIFQIKEFIGDGTFKFVSFDEIVLSGLNTQQMEFRLVDRPTLSKGHQFAIKLSKSNGEVIEIETNEVNWL